jgi:type I restriction enzyme S subunit
MELRDGYKQTEVGVIPEDWEVTKLSNVIDSKRSIRYGIVQPGKFELNGCLMLRSQDYSKGWTNSEEMHRVNSTIENQYKNARLAKDDLIMTVVGAGIGQVVIAPKWLDGAIVSRSTARIAIDNSKAAKEFISSCLTSPIGVRQILDVQKEGAQPVVSCLDLADFKIPFPSFAEQTAIATALSVADALITSLEKLIEKKRAIKQGAMQELFIPKDNWQEKTYGEIFLFLNTATYSRAQLTVMDELKYIHYGDIHTKWDFYLDIQKSSLPSIQNDQLKGYAIIKDGDVIMADASEDYNGVGKSVEVKNVRNTKAIAGLHTFLLRDVNGVFVNGFRSYLHIIRSVKKQFDELATGMKVYGVSKANLKNVFIPVPPILEQTRIATILSDMDAEITALEQKLGKYKMVKQGMMQELLTGRIRLI